ncbi:MAG TPA: hypothetical protein VGV39_26240 [Mesorhizobium sp.]|jgi:nitrous oxide reductase accessory protein NosL|uniref:hypothetical protein n=1 Tax=Mesorhizobium sp. TaxID=1871066 RepID=UPI002DDCF1F1|nr:hypothetical protein [Mesorhizobium sp.]HEV2506601.1 hypothetical protein [Mesorhizobium sp.]
MKRKVFALLAATAVLAGNQTAQAANKAEIKAANDRCVTSYASIPLSTKEEIRGFMGVSKERAPALFCQRLVRAFVSGRITFSDLNRLQENRSTEIWKVIKGR